jgi:hypothetical protein
MMAMVSTKTLADALTALRFGLAWNILRLGMSEGADALSTVTMVLLLAWITDVLDGPLARRDPTGRHTWIGDRDLEVDISVSIGVLTYLVLAGFVSPTIALGYGLGCAVLLGQTRSRHLAWAVQAPPYAAIILFALRDVPNYGLIAVGYVVLIVVATWPRFPRVVVPQFLAGVRDLAKPAEMDRELPVEEPMVVENGNGNGQRWQQM